MAESTSEEIPIDRTNDTAQSSIRRHLLKMVLRALSSDNSKSLHVNFVDEFFKAMQESLRKNDQKATSSKYDERNILAQLKKAAAHERRQMELVSWEVDVLHCPHENSSNTVMYMSCVRCSTYIDALLKEDNETEADRKKKIVDWMAENSGESSSGTSFVEVTHPRSSDSFEMVPKVNCNYNESELYDDDGDDIEDQLYCDYYNENFNNCDFSDEAKSERVLSNVSSASSDTLILSQCEEWNKQRPFVTFKSGKTDGKCYKCNLFGHLSKDCLLNTGKKDKLDRYMSTKSEKEQQYRRRIDEETRRTFNGTRKCIRCGQANNHKPKECWAKDGGLDECFWCWRKGVRLSTCPRCSPQWKALGGKYNAETRDKLAKPTFVRVPRDA